MAPSGFGQLMWDVFMRRATRHAEVILCHEFDAGTHDQKVLAMALARGMVVEFVQSVPLLTGEQTREMIGPNSECRILDGSDPVSAGAGDGELTPYDQIKRIEGVSEQMVRHWNIAHDPFRKILFERVSAQVNSLTSKWSHRTQLDDPVS